MVWRSISGLLWQNGTKQETIVQTEYDDEFDPLRESFQVCVFRSKFSPVAPSLSRGWNKLPLWWRDDTFNTHLSYKDTHLKFFIEHIARSTSTSSLPCIPHEIFTQKRDAHSSVAMSWSTSAVVTKCGLHWCGVAVNDHTAMIFSRTALPLVWYRFHTTLLQTLFMPFVGANRWL